MIYLKSLIKLKSKKFTNIICIILLGSIYYFFMIKNKITYNYINISMNVTMKSIIILLILVSLSDCICDTFCILCVNSTCIQCQQYYTLHPNNSCTACDIRC